MKGGLARPLSIELIRFCLGVKGYTADSNKRSLDHAISVLGSGQVTVTLLEGESKIVITRSCDDERPRSSGQFVAPVIFSQTEIESIGLQASGRLRLLDGFFAGRSRLESQEQSAISEAQSLTAEVNAVRRDLSEFEQQIAALPDLDKRLLELAPQEKKLAQLSAEAAKRTAALDAITKTSSSLAVASAYIDRFRQSLNRFRTALNSAAQVVFAPEEWRNPGTPDPLSAAKKSLEAAISSLQKAVQEATSAESAVAGNAKSVSDQKVNVDNQSRQLRSEIEGLQQGAGAVTRQAQQLRERKAQLRVPEDCHCREEECTSRAGATERRCA